MFFGNLSRMLQQQPSHSPRLSTALHREESWGALWRGALIRLDGTTRTVPDVVEDAIKRLQGMQTSAENSPAHATPERHTLAASLKGYIDMMQRIERRGFDIASLAPNLSTALFTYISSERSVSNFKSFINAAEFPQELYSIRDEIFARESPRLFWNVMKIADAPGSSKDLSGFSRLILDCFRFAELPTVWESVKVMAKLFATGHATEKEFLQCIYDAENRSLIPGSTLRTASENLFHDKLFLSRDGERALYLIGSAIVERSNEQSLKTWGALISHPAIEFGYIKQRIATLSRDPSSREAQGLLYGLLKSGDKYLDTLPSEVSKDGLHTMQAALIVAITRCEPNVGALLIDAASPLVSLSWGPGIVPMWRECARPSSPDSPSVAVPLLRAALRSKRVSYEIRDELLAAEGLMNSSVKEEDKKRYTELVQGFYANLRHILWEERVAKSGDPLIIQGALRVVRSSPELSRASLKELMGMLGIPVVSLNPFGFVCLPGIAKRSEVAVHRAAAREVIRQHEHNLGWFGRWRLQLFDRQQQGVSF